MSSTRLFFKPFVVLFAVAMMATAGAPNDPDHMDDKSDAWASVSQMIKFIGMGDQSSTERAGNDAIGSIEKAIDREENSGNKDKLRDAKTQVREALGHTAKGEWPYAEGAAKRALKLIEDVK